MRSDRTRAGYVGIGAILIAVSALAALVPAVVHWSSPTPRSVAVVGDSITVLTSPDISVALRGDYHTDVQAKWGQRIDQMLPNLSELLGQHPTAVVENLGSNDAIQATTHPDWQKGFEQMIAMLAPTKCVLMTTVSTFLDADYSAPPVASEINRAIEGVASRRPNFHVVDWNAAIHAPNGGTLLSADHVHPSPAGQLTLAALIRPRSRLPPHLIGVIARPSPRRHRADLRRQSVRHVGLSHALSNGRSGGGRHRDLHQLWHICVRRSRPTTGPVRRPRSRRPLASCLLIIGGDWFLHGCTNRSASRVRARRSSSGTELFERDQAREDDVSDPVWGLMLDWHAAAARSKPDVEDYPSIGLVVRCSERSVWVVSLGWPTRRHPVSRARVSGRRRRSSRDRQAARCTKHSIS
jgi:lysophospholipase L1-like esterase